MSRETILKVDNLIRNFGDIKAVKDVSFTVKRGSLFAFLGPNGAGKSTTIKMITTLLRKDGGKVYINDSSDENYIRNKIGVVFQDNVLDDLLSVKDNLIFRGSLYNNDKISVINRYDELSKKLDLVEIENQQFKSLSGGQKRRVEIARALFSNPEILILDEPTTGLDPESRKQVWGIINDLKDNDNLTVFLTTHYMEEAANADYVVIIHKGLIKVEGTPNELKDKYSKDVMRIVPIDNKLLVNYLKSKKIDYKKTSDMYILTINNSLEAIEHLEQQKGNIEQFEVVKGTMDDVFINIIGDEYVSID